MFIMVLLKRFQATKKVMQRFWFQSSTRKYRAYIKNEKFVAFMMGVKNADACQASFYITQWRSFYESL